MEKKHASQIQSPPSGRPSELLTPQARGFEAIYRAYADRVSDVVKCANPFIRGGFAFGCSTCMVCRVNRRRVWTHRIMLEASQYKDNAFVTLTYDDEHLPEGQTLRPEHATLFLKKLRFAIQPLKIRYFLVGEYGDETERPHYHACLFNYPSCSRGRTFYRNDGRCCASCDQVRKSWALGNVYLGALEHASAAYCAGYVVKKLTDPKDPKLNGRFPEFSRMSSRPGIGGDVMDDVASALLEVGLDEDEDVPVALRHGAKAWPLGRYLRRRLRERIGRDPSTPPHVLAKMEAELLPLRTLAHAYAPKGHKQFAFKNEVIESGRGQRARLEALQRLHKKRSSI